MPRSHNIDDDRRETVDLHADWWSPLKTEDGAFDGVPCKEGGRYVERCAVFATRLHDDDEWVNKQVYGTMKAPTKAGQVIDTSMTAKAPTYLLQRMVTELTDDQGTTAIMIVNGGRRMLSERYIRGLDKRDTEFIIGQLDEMKEPPVPVTEANIAAADANATKRSDLLAGGWPDNHPLVRNTGSGDAETLAQDGFRLPRETYIPE